jgi:predicted Fe-Mo cluster-binding NifX family protein
VKQTLLQEKYPVYSLALEPGETSFRSVDEIIGYFKERIQAHRSACLIAEFDHFAHTSALPEGRIGEGIRAAKNLIFCFGIALPDPHVLAVRPRSIGVAETDEGFFITFMEAPMPVANSVMEDWATGLRSIGRAGADERPHTASPLNRRQRTARTIMRIGVTSQNFRTVTGHAGKTRRFLIYEADGRDAPREVERLDLPKEMSLHEHHGDDHPVYGLDAVVTGSCGAGFVQRLARFGVRVVATSETDPATAVAAVAAGRELPPAEPHGGH